jgi:hypothetical protein
MERFLERGCEPTDLCFVYFKVWGYSEELAGNWMPIEIGWSVLNLFNKEEMLLYK